MAKPVKNVMCAYAEKECANQNTKASIRIEIFHTLKKITICQDLYYRSQVKMKLTYEHIAMLTCGQWSPHLSGVHSSEESTFRPGTLGYSYKSELTPIDL